METRAEVTNGEELRDLLTRVEQGEEVTITRDGKPVAKVIPVQSEDPLLEAARRAREEAAVEGIRKLGAQVRLNGLSIRALIEEGRH